MKKINLIFAGFLGIGAVFCGCAKLTPQKTQAVAFSIISPNLRLNDTGFIRSFKNQTELQVYSSGVSVLSLVAKNESVCMNNACDDEPTFNEKFFKNAHYKGFLGEILGAKAIYGAKNLAKTDCGFEQNLGEISYSVCDDSGKIIKFSDKKAGVKISVRELL
ncbi:MULTISPECIES: hypothetical protein [unclassified Campylobacter]|uniref:hypothetical protein n=1 Tax=unclassified Campylobacter TaxID=2593542 RepID=UPI0022E99752|nr:MULTISPECIES: hypothetical protein [unclassified Campylobacter]MDA3043332.1 hypothetical protein [Campylobacter sp. JMF_09 ED2]MDA3044979.1 hypothetical protein [Campylobacter sp. JMF_07 ED4]MDA3054666.1 hypothetical protein [Campylobacter sp. VBCF_07 NA4]MDA3061300.1 hypothetical protein [Campylobacter sp. VBCF_02 NA5]MDA3064421.1 hypothetical protein [Campylobacter sp. JMF_11 EL3]